ncbi:RNA-directed DNA polymerase, eukaryota, reverse transcriptase zinc-binding domain protein [Tanacetum coccineum]|uniref:RNA-directed DNA polymerase, eukaryota, reverse transcriptase zinc-binding domain protein n=1 Tax=Tanacetum coccineum TaxID=301880 RepID=A0ABQ5A4H7_9ASTR
MRMRTGMGIRLKNEDDDDAMKRSANKYSLFEMYDVNEQNELNELKNVEIVDSFLNRGVRPTKDNMKRWSIEMIAYYKQKSEELVDKGKTTNIEVEDNIEMEDVLEEIGGIAKCMKENVVKGREDGCRMFKTVKNLKGLKKHLKQLAWCNGDVFENVKKLIEVVKDVQMKIDKDPNNHDLRSEDANVLKLYSEAMKDEEKIIVQKAKVKWLSVGDRNNAYFHKTIKSRQQRNIIDAVCDENGKRFEGNDLNSAEAEYMVREVSNEEIKIAMFQINDNKAPGLDGYSVAFFKKAWNIVVPKIQTPLKVSDFRPIAYCNVIYKCISKLLTEILKGCLDKLVSKNQSAFIPNRHIQDNIMLAQELFKGYDRKAGLKRVAVKSYGYFKGGRGLRQDPISPYLFTLVMEILTLIVKRKVDQSREFQYHFGCKKLKITNVCFADDLLMFCHADKSSVKVLKESIDEFGKVVGLIPNYNKSTIIFGCLDDEEKKDMLEVMPFKVEKLPIRYLGTPLTSKRLRANKCKSLLDKVESRVSSWKNKCLTYAGRLMLVASVLETIHVKMMAPKEELKWLGIMSAKSLWVKWINTEKLRGRSVWEVEVDTNDSWGWKNILSFRKDVRQFMFSKIGDGNRISVWYDNWSNIEGWTDEFPILKAIQRPVLNNDVMDKVLWKKKNGKLCKFSVKQAYEDVLEGKKQQNFRDEMRSPNKLYKISEDTIRMRLMSLTIKNFEAVKKAQEVWNVKLNIMENLDLQLQAPCILESTGCDCTHQILIPYPVWPWEETSEECLGL